MGTGPEAWVTIAVDDSGARKALTLAASLREVCTAKKLVVFVSWTVGKDMRDKLKEAFDLVLKLEQDSPNGLSLEDYAKAEALSLTVFQKCVFLSPSMLVMNNCDEIFWRYKALAAVISTDLRGDEDVSIFVFTPSREYRQVVEQIFAQSDVNRTNKKINVFVEWLKSNEELEKLDKKYDVRLALHGQYRQSLNTEVSIVNFVDGHPLDHPEKISCLSLETLEKFAAEYCMNVYLKKVESRRIFQLSQCKSEPIAIVGMSFRLPGGNNVDEFWSLLSEGRSAIVPVPFTRWTKERTLCANKNEKVEAGFLSDPIDEWDSAFFGHSAQDAEYLDPQKRLLLEVTWEALEDALIDPLTLKGTKTGVFVGSWVQEYHEMVLASVDDDYFRRYIGNSVASNAAKISHVLETVGPCIGTDSGCSSSMASVDLACKSLRHGNSDVAIAAGVNLLLRPFDHKTFEVAFSPEFRCKTFDASADGYARAEACTVLILKRLSDAIMNGDNIVGLIRGTALTQEGVSKSMGTPTVHCERLAMELALEDAGISPREVSYVEAHGTGTVVGDPIEIQAIEQAYSKRRIEPLVIGSVKTNVGHTEGASGITGIIKVLLSMKHELIPRHLNLKTLNPKINLDVIPAKIPLDPMPWPKTKGKPRIAGVNSFGITGTDGHAVIEEPPTETSQPCLKFKAERPFHLMKISAKSAESMDMLLQKYLETMKKINKGNDINGPNFADIAYSANIGRATFNHRAVITANSVNEAAEQLEKKTFKRTEILSGESKICFLFTGQGSQYPNMGKQLYESSPVFKACFDQCDEILQRRYKFSIRNVIWQDSDELNKTLYSQTSIFVLEYCLLKLWESWGVKPDYVLGHSLGEFAAAIAASALTLEDAIMLVAERSRLIDNLPAGKMLVMKATMEKVSETVSAFQNLHSEFWVDYAALNSPEQTVIAGDSKWIEEFSAFCTAINMKTTILAATHAFHSRHMDPMLDAYRKVAVTCRKPKSGSAFATVYISGMEGKVMDPPESIDADYWVRHTREKVNFMDACRVAKEKGCTLFLEIGPHPVLSALTMRNFESEIACLPSLNRKEGDWDTMINSLSQLYLSNWKGEIDWNGFDRLYERKKVKLPFYPFSRKPIWKDYEPVPPKMHPLLGHSIATASKETIYRNSITFKNTEFVSDHVIGNTVIFPGAGFLEMCLAGGHATVEGYTEKVLKPKRPIFMKTFQISSPMDLQENVICKVQTLVSLNDQRNDIEEIGYSVEVHRHLGNDDKSQWIQHAAATFIPMPPSMPTHLLQELDISVLQATGAKWDSRKAYERLPQFGLHFGTQFQSLESGWRSGNGMLFSVKVPSDHKAYIMHPVVADAMIQSVLVWRSCDDPKLKLHVPVQIKQFVWLKKADSTSQFVYCTNDENHDDHCFLLDASGTPLAYMTGVEFIKTTAKLIEGMIKQQSTEMPRLWEEVWRSCPGPMQGYLTHDTPSEKRVLNEDEQKCVNDLNNISTVEENFYKNIAQSSRYLVLRALYYLGWKPEVGHAFSVESLMQELKIRENFANYIRFFLRAMAGENCNIFKAVDLEKTNFHFLEKPPALPEVELTLKELASIIDNDRTEYRLMIEVGTHLSQIFTGKADPLAVLFPTDATKISSAKYYEDSWKTLNCSYPIELHVRQHLQSAVRSFSTESQRPIYRILEIGAGTGVCTKPLLNHIIPSVVGDKCDIEYYVTDISASFFSPIEKAIRVEQRKSLVFKKYDMEQDPLDQGLCPGYFDMITATSALHIAKDIRKLLRNIRSILKAGGMLLIVETLCPDVYISFLFGLLGGYWQFTDTDLRQNHTSLTFEMWSKALASSGFVGTSCIPLYNNAHGVISSFASQVENNFLDRLYPPHKSWIIFSSHENDWFTDQLSLRLASVARCCKVVPKPSIKEFTEDFIKTFFKNLFKQIGNPEGIIYLWSLSPSTRDQRQVSLPFLSLIQIVSEMNIMAKTFAILKGACTIQSSDVIDPTPGTIVGFFKSLANENVHLSSNVTFFDLDPMKATNDQLDEVFMNFWVGHKQPCAFRNGLRLYPKFKATKISIEYEALVLPSACDRFQLRLPNTRLLSDLEFIPLELYSIDELQVEVKVKATALNFIDVFTVLKPSPYFTNFKTLGLDFAGVISKVGAKVSKVKVGDRVMGMNLGDGISLPSHRKVFENQVVPLPNKMTFAEGATLPVATTTAIHCLLHIAKMKKGETVLVHTASGGVGLAAIQICKKFGTNVIATAGSHRKQMFLKNLGIQHVFQSRSTDFKMGVLEVTNGRGVDIVLNSITGSGFKEASLDCLRKGGRFVEMSKLNAWKTEEVKVLRPDVFYQRFDLTQLKDCEYNELFKVFRDFIENEIVRPIRYERFDALNISAALSHLQNARHIGKVICTMPELKMENKKLIITSPLFNEDSTYLITGGLGGIGFEVATWMLSNGAKYIALVGRNLPAQAKALQIEKWNKQGYHVRAFAVDIGDKEKLEELLEKLKSPQSVFPPVRGVMHAAGVLDDALLGDQSWEKYSNTYRSKVNGSWNLHDLTKEYLLEHFVFFSSVASTVGSPGQSNHCASNAFQDAIASYRLWNCLPATCVNWSTWGEAGIATGVEYPGVRSISTNEALFALQAFLKSHTSHRTVINADTFSLVLNIFPNLLNYLDDSNLLGTANKCQIANSEDFWLEIDSLCDRNKTVECFKKMIRILVHNLLRMKPDEHVNDDSDLQTLGIDSLMMLEVKNGIQKILGCRMTLQTTELQDCTTIKSIAEHLSDILDGKLCTKGLTDEQRKQLVREDCNLLSNTLGVGNLKCKSIEQVETVLLTGATGSLGPYILAELTQRHQVKNVYCLIRPSCKLSGHGRLLKRLADLQVTNNVVMEKVSVIDGDITKPNLGLEEQVYSQLCETIDAVVHCAAKVDHLAKYQKSSSQNIDSRSVNVLGTLRLLEFAAERTLKHFFHASTIYVAFGSGKDGNFSTSWHSEGTFDDISLVNDMGYHMSKHISDQLVHKAVLQGMPCKVFRFALFSGDSKTGRVDYKHNHYLLRFLACLKLELVYDLPYPIIVMAADHSAKISLEIFFNKDAPADIYNIVHKSVETISCLVEVGQAFGKVMKTTSYNDFLHRLVSLGAKSPVLAFHDLYQEKKNHLIDYFTKLPSPFMRLYAAKDVKAMDTERLMKYAPSYTKCIESHCHILTRCLTFMKNNGAFYK